MKSFTKHLNRASSAIITDNNHPEYFICILMNDEGTLSAFKFSKPTSNEPEAIHPNECSLQHSSLNFDLTTTIGKYLLRKFIKDPEYRVIPDTAKQLIEFISKNRLSVVVGPNHSSTLDGCDGASKVRKHLVDAQEYMPIYDELKSIFIKIGKKGHHRIALVHCRGNRSFDSRKISGFFHTQLGLSKKNSKQISFLSTELLEEAFGLKKGLVTPFLDRHQYKGSPIVHIFDTDCLKSYGMPMMTNATDADWATEFDAPTLINEFIKIDPNRYFVHQIVEGFPSETLDALHRYHGKILGVVEYGLPAATLFRNELNSEARKVLASKSEFLGRNSEAIPMVHAGTFSEFSQFSISSPEFEKVMEPDLYETDVRNKVTEVIGTLTHGGCNAIAIPCNILPYYAPQENTTIWSVTEAVQEAIAEQTGRGLFLGGKSSRDPIRSIYRGKLNQTDDERISFLTAKQAEEIDEAMMAVNTNRYDYAAQKMYSAIKPYVRDLQFIVVASTSLSVFVRDHGTLLDTKFFEGEDLSQINSVNKLPIIDTLSTYAKYCARKLFE